MNSYKWPRDHVKHRCSYQFIYQNDMENVRGDSTIFMLDLEDLHRIHFRIWAAFSHRMIRTVFEPRSEKLKAER